MKTPPELDKIVDVVLAHRPKEKQRVPVYGRVGEGVLYYKNGDKKKRKKAKRAKGA